MNATQAENLRILIRHMETSVSRTLNMTTIRNECGTPACALGEAGTLPHFNKIGFVLTKPGANHLCAWRGQQDARGWIDAVRSMFGLDKDRLFGVPGANAWERAAVTPQEWATEARKVLAENGYSMDEPKAINSCPRGYGECQEECAYPGRCYRGFMAKVQEPVLTPMEEAAMKLDGAALRR